eukprot:16451985-Heterocapsa_arctica.AAC.1
MREAYRRRHQGIDDLPSDWDVTKPGEGTCTMNGTCTTQWWKLCGNNATEGRDWVAKTPREPVAVEVATRTAEPDQGRPPRRSQGSGWQGWKSPSP